MATTDGSGGIGNAQLAACEVLFGRDWLLVVLFWLPGAQVLAGLDRTI
jgi:hypothetical protein